MGEMIKAIIFDVGGVVVKVKVEDVFHKIADDLKINYDSLWKLFLKNKKNLVTGKISSKEFSKIVKQKFDINEDVFEVWKNSYKEILELNENVIEILNKLKKNYKVAVITDSTDLMESVVKDAGIYSLFDFSIISCEVGYVKPQKEIFEIALKKIGTSPEECIFIDDRSEHIETPKGMGFNTILFKDAEQLKKELKSLGVKF